MRNCVISAVGRSSLHREWMRGGCHFDLHLLVYDDSYGEFVNDTPFVCRMKGYKLKLVYQYILSNPEVLENYEYFFIPDDDISMDSDKINALFGMMRHYGLQIAQPSLVNSYYLWGHTLRDPYCVLRYTNFVEMMVPCFSREALGKILFTFGENETGWGTETHWPFLIDAGRKDMAIIDSVFVVHTRPIQSGQTVHRREAMEYLGKYGLVTQVMEYGYVPIGGSEAYLLKRETYRRMVSILKVSLPRVFKSESLGMDGYGGYAWLLYGLGLVTQSRVYADMAERMLGQTVGYWKGSSFEGRALAEEYLEKSSSDMERYLDTCLSANGCVAPLAKAYRAYKKYRETHEESSLLELEKDLQQVQDMALAFEDQLMLAYMLVNNQIEKDA